MAKEKVCTGDPTGPGRQHLALLIGVGDYAATDIPDLHGTVNDVEAFRIVLTDPNGAFALAPENICTLVDGEATIAGVLGAFDSFLLDRIDNEDHVTIFYAGHGGQLEDRTDFGESDHRDETLVLHDSQSPIGEDAPGLDHPHLTDDVFAALLEAVNTKLTEDREGQHALTVILDSCNSLSATRGEIGGVRYYAGDSARYSGGGERRFAPIQMYLEAAGLEDVVKALELADNAEDFRSVVPPGAVLLSAAGDGAAAHEADGNGVFTSALIRELSILSEPITYAQLEWRVRSGLRNALQTPGFHGELDALIFSNVTRGSGGSHRVSKISGNKLTLTGPPLLGIGPGAEFRLYKGNHDGRMGDLSATIGILKVTSEDRINPTGMLQISGNGIGVSEGDIAVLIADAPKVRKLKVRAEKGLNEDVLGELRALLVEDDEAVRSVVLLREDNFYTMHDLFLKELPLGRIGVFDRVGKLRVDFATTPEGMQDLVKRLSSFARQKAFRGLHGEGGGLLIDNQTIQVSLEPFDEPGTSTRCDPSYKIIGNIKRVGRSMFKVPVCMQYRFVIEAAASLKRELQIGVLYLSSDGNIYSIPGGGNLDGESQRWRLTPPDPRTGLPGQLRIVLPDIYQSFAPPGPQDDVIVFAVEAKTPVPWWRLARNARTRSKEPMQSGLYRELSAYMGAGTRSDGGRAFDEPLSVWTTTRIGLRSVGDRSALKAFMATTGREGEDDWSALWCQTETCLTGDEE